MSHLPVSNLVSMNTRYDHIAETIDVSLDPSAVRQIAMMPDSTYRQIAELFGVSIHDLRRFMDTHKIPINQKTPLEIRNPALNFDNVYMLSLEMNSSYLSIARTIGVSNHTIRRFMLKNGISLVYPCYHSASVRALQQTRSDSSDRISVLSLLNP